MKVLLFVPKGVEITELSAFIDIFGWDRHYNQGNIEVVTFGLTRQIKSTFDLRIEVDLLLPEVNIAEYDALGIPGGFAEYGFYDDANSEPVLDLIRRFNAEDKLIASICVGALPLGKSGVLQGRNATTYHMRGGIRQQQLAEYGVNIVQEPVVQDGNVITSWGPSTAPEVALKLLGLLRTPEAANKVRELMGY